jgi:LacI family transcriptional regulator
VSTIREVSSLAGVSISTVSRVLNDTAPVAPETKERVLAAVKELEYQPNAFARSLVTKRSGYLGVTVNEISSLFFGALLKGIEDKAESVGMQLIVSSGHARKDQERRAIHFLYQRRPDALIVEVEALSNEELKELAREGFPFVVMGRYVEGLPSVYLDNEAGGRMATEYLLGQGHRNIAHISGPMYMQDSQARLSGYKQALESYNLTFNERLVLEGDFSERKGQEKTRELLSRSKDFTAMFAADDQTAAGAMRALREAGLQVPEDVSIIGYDDILFAEFLHPLLTTIRQPLSDMGQAAADIALALMNGRETEVIRRFEPQLIIRESVKQL